MAKTAKQVCNEIKRNKAAEKQAELNEVIRKITNRGGMYSVDEKLRHDSSSGATHFYQEREFYDSSKPEILEKLKKLGYEISILDVTEDAKDWVYVTVKVPAVKFLGITLRKERTERHGELKDTKVTYKRLIIRACCGEGKKR